MTPSSSSSQQSSPRSPSTSSPISSRPRGKIGRPESGSLNDILREYAGISLYVLPIYWTDLHTKLLGVRFVELDPVLTPVPGPELCNRAADRPSLIAIVLGRELTNLLAAEKFPRWAHKIGAIKYVLSTLFPATLSKPKSNAELDLYFGGRVFQKAIQLPVLWKHPDCVGSSFDSAVTRPATPFGRIPARSCDSNHCGSLASSQHSSNKPSTNQPTLAYVNRRQLQQIRKHLYRVRLGLSDSDEVNTPVFRLQQLRSKQLIPADVDRDAHYVAILLTMAQAHFYNEGPSKPSPQSCARFSPGCHSIDVLPTNFRDVKVQLITHDDQEANFIVYTAIVTATFLERFARPAEAPAKSSPDSSSEGAPNTGLEILFARVPIWPIFGLKERLSKAFGRDIAGESHFQNHGGSTSDNLETWETIEERKERQQMYSRKRQRPVDREVERNNSADALYQSLTEDLPVVSPNTRRRCTRGWTS